MPSFPSPPPSPPSFDHHDPWSLPEVTKTKKQRRLHEKQTAKNSLAASRHSKKSRAREEREMHERIELALQNDKYSGEDYDDFEVQDALSLSLSHVANRSKNNEQTLLDDRLNLALAEESAVVAFQPTADSIDSLILSISLSTSLPENHPSQPKNLSLEQTPSSCTGLSNFSRGSFSSKAGTVNNRERASIIGKGGVQPLADSLDSKCSDFLRECAADALANLAGDKSGRKVIGGSGAIEKLVLIIADAAHPSSSLSARQSSLSEYAAACLRNLALDSKNATLMASYGCIPAMIQLCRDGLPVTKGMCACCLACIAQDDSRCEMIIDYGATGPLIQMLGSEEGVVVLSASGCLNELSRLKTNCIKIAKLNGFQKLIEVLRKDGDFLREMVQEKAISILFNLCLETSLHKQALECGAIEMSIKQLNVGTDFGKISACNILCQLTDLMTDEQRRQTTLPIAGMLNWKRWAVKTAGAAASLKLYRNDDEKIMFVHTADGLNCLMQMLSERDPRVHENTLSAILSLLENSEVPDLLLSLDPGPRLVRMIPALNMTVRKLAFGILKCLSIYDLNAVLAFMPLHQHYHLEHPPDEFENFIKVFIEKRKAKGYLSRVGELAKSFTDVELKEYEELFVELDADSSGSIDAAEISLLIEVTTGLKPTPARLQVIIKAADTDNSGVIEWDEFLQIMYDIKYGKKAGIFSILGQALTLRFTRSRLGVGVSGVLNYINRKQIRMDAMIEEEERERFEMEERARMADLYWENEKIKREREKEERRILKQSR